MQGRKINLSRLILPSPECDVSINASKQICAIIKTANPRQARDMSIGDFVVAFGIFREVLCSVFPQRRKELDGYLALIGDLNLRYGKNVFYQYHKGFSSKAALQVTHCNTLLDWSVLDTELLVMLVGGSQAVSCSSCGDMGHMASLCPLVPFQTREPGSPPRASRRVSSTGLAARFMLPAYF